MDFDPEIGVRRLRELFKSRSLPIPTELALLEARLQRNLRSHRMYGDSDNNKAEWAQIIDDLIQFADTELGISFNDLCHRQTASGDFARRKAPQRDDDDDDEPLPAPNFASRKNWAIFVGVNSYDDQANYHTLQVCAADANALAQQFTANGFFSDHMQLIKDDNEPDNLPTRGNILNTLQTTANVTQPDDLLLFYYSGHGDVEENESYLVPRDGWASSLEDTAIPFSRVKRIMQNAPARNKVIILDACHAGAPIGSKGQTRMPPRFIKHVFEQAEGIAILSSCTQNQFSYESVKRGQSAYTYFLLQALQGHADAEEKGLVTVRDLNNYVTDKVKAWAAQQKRTQSPTISSEMIGEIIVCTYALAK